MTRRLAFLLIVVLAVGAATAEEEAKGIAWMHDLDRAIALAKEDGRPVIAYFTFET